MDELKESVKFTGAKYEELKEKSQKVESKLEVDMRVVYQQIEGRIPGESVTQKQYQNTWSWRNWGWKILGWHRKSCKRFAEEETQHSRWSRHRKSPQGWQKDKGWSPSWKCLTIKRAETYAYSREDFLLESQGEHNTRGEKEKTWRHNVLAWPFKENSRKKTRTNSRNVRSLKAR